MVHITLSKSPDAETSKVLSLWICTMSCRSLSNPFLCHNMSQLNVIIWSVSEIKKTRMTRMTIPLLNKNISTDKHVMNQQKCCLHISSRNYVPTFFIALMQVMAMDYFWIQNCVPFCQFVYCENTVPLRNDWSESSVLTKVIYRPKSTDIEIEKVFFFHDILYLLLISNKDFSN